MHTTLTYITHSHTHTHITHITHTHKHHTHIYTHALMYITHTHSNKQSWVLLFCFWSVYVLWSVWKFAFIFSQTDHCSRKMFWLHGYNKAFHCQTWSRMGPWRCSVLYWDEYLRAGHVSAPAYPISALGRWKQEDLELQAGFDLKSGMKPPWAPWCLSQ